MQRHEHIAHKGEMRRRGLVEAADDGDEHLDEWADARRRREGGGEGDERGAEQRPHLSTHTARRAAVRVVKEGADCGELEGVCAAGDAGWRVRAGRHVGSARFSAAHDTHSTQGVQLLLRLRRLLLLLLRR